MEFNQFGNDIHVCVGRKEGDQFIYECPDCGYKVIFQEKMGEPGRMRTYGGNPYYSHTGTYVSPLAPGMNNN